MCATFASLTAVTNSGYCRRHHYGCHCGISGGDDSAAKASQGHAFLCCVATLPLTWPLLYLSTSSEGLLCPSRRITHRCSSLKPMFSIKKFSRKSGCFLRNRATLSGEGSGRDRIIELLWTSESPSGPKLHSPSFVPIAMLSRVLRSFPNRNFFTFPPFHFNDRQPNERVRPEYLTPSVH